MVIYRDSHSGIYNTKITYDKTIYFGSKSAQDISGWEITNDCGELLFYSDVWEDASESEIEKSLNELEKILNQLQVENTAELMAFFRAKAND